MNQDYFYYGKNPKTPKLNPMQGLRWRRVWYLPPLYLWGQYEHNIEKPVKLFMDILFIISLINLLTLTKMDLV